MNHEHIEDAKSAINNLKLEQEEKQDAIQTANDGVKKGAEKEKLEEPRLDATQNPLLQKPENDTLAQMEIPATLDEVPEEAHSEIQESLKVKNYVFQFIDHETGKRSEPFVGKYDTLKQIINTAQEREQKPTDDDYILLVCVIGDDDENTIIPGTPLIKVATFMQLGA